MGRAFLHGLGTGSSTVSGQAPGRRRERHGRLSAACALAAAFVLLLGAGGAKAESHKVSLELGRDLTNSVAAHAPTGTAEPGPGAGEITLRWQPANTGPQGTSFWRIYAKQQSSGNVTQIWTEIGNFSTRSYTFTGLKAGVTWTVGVARTRGRFGSGFTPHNGDIAQARLQAPPPPLAIDSASVDGATVKLVFSVEIDGNSVPAKGSFSVSLGGVAQAPTGVSVSGKTLTLALATAAAAGQGGLLTYTKPRTKPLRDVFGREVKGFANLTVVNATGGVATADAGADQGVQTGASVTLEGSGASTRTSPTLTYAWKQTAGVPVTLSGATTTELTFTAPSVRTDLVFALTVNDGMADSAPDTVTVRVRPPSNPSTAPCVHPAPAGTTYWGGSLLDSVTATDDTIRFAGTGLAAALNSFWFCRPDGTRDTLAQDVRGGSSGTVTGLAKGTTYWLAVKWTTIHDEVRWQDWQAVTTTGSATAAAGEDQEVLTGATVTLDGSGSSTTRSGATLTYAWTQTAGATVPLSSTTAQAPTFTAPTVRTNLVFSLVVNDGADSPADTVTVRVRPPPNPSSAPCVHPSTGRGTPGIAPFNLTIQSTGDSSFSFTPVNRIGAVHDLFLCRPSGTREEVASGVGPLHVQTVQGLASATTYWVTMERTVGGVLDWTPWVAATTTGAASIRRVAFANAPASGDSYLLGETIRATVTWSVPVTVDTRGPNENLHLRLDLGADDANYVNSRKLMRYASGSPTDTLTFEYAVQPGDVDPDGVWVQTESASVHNLVVRAKGATIRNGTHDAGNTLSGLPTTGDAGRKVDGTSTARAAAGEDREVLTGASVTLSGSGSSTTGSTTFTYRWTQTGGETVTLTGATSATPSFTAPTVRTDLVFSLTVSDGAVDSPPDTVTVRVRPPPNPSSAPCVHPRPADENWLSAGDWFFDETVTDSSISFRGFIGGTAQLSYWLCRPNGVRTTLSQNVANSHTEMISSLESGTTYWVALKQTVSGSAVNTGWQDWRAFTTTGAASIRRVAFANAPASGDTYLLGETIRAAVTWSAPVTVDAKGSNDNVLLRLDLGEDDQSYGNSQRLMSYVSGSPTDTLTFEYEVQSGDLDRDGVWVQTESATAHNLVVLTNGATIRNGTTTASNVRAGLPTRGDAGRKVDGTGRVTAVKSAVVTGTTLELTFNEALDASSVPAAVAFTVQRTPPAGSAERVRLTGTPAIDGARVTLTLATAVARGDAVTVGYQAPARNPLRNAAGTPVPDFADRAVTNATANSGDTVKPTLVQGKIHGSAVELVFSEALDGSAVPATDRFALRPALGAVSGVAVNGRRITFTTATASTAALSMSVGITAPTGIRDLNGNALDAVSGFALINTQAADPGKPALVATNPAVVDGAALTLKFDKVLHAATVPGPGAFTVTVAGAGRDVAGTAVSGSAVVLTLAAPAAKGETVTVSFDASKGAIQNPWGTRADGFTGQAAVNTTANRAPVFSAGASTIAAPSGTSVSLGAEASDPDGDEVTYALRLGRDDTHVPGELHHDTGTGSVRFMARDGCELANLVSAPNPLLTVVTVTATDAHGATAERSLTFSTAWTCEAPALTALSVAGTAVTLTFDENLAATTAKQRGDLRYAFTVQGGYHLGTPVVNQSPDVAVDGATVTLTLGSGVPPGGKASVTYHAARAASLGAGLRDTDGNAVGSFERTATAAAGTARPLLEAARVAGTSLTLTFDRALDEGSAPAGSRFWVETRSVDGRTAPRSVEGTGTARVDGKQVAVRLAASVEQYERAYVWYRKGDDANPLRAASSGPEVAEIWGFLGVEVDDRTAPQFGSAVLAGTKLTLYYGETLDRHSTPAAGDFVVTAAGTEQTVSGVKVHASAVALTLGAEIDLGVAVEVSYTADEEPIRDLVGNDAANLSREEAINKGPDAPGTLGLLGTEPAVAQHGVLTLTWNQPLDPAHVPGTDAFTLSQSEAREVTSVTVRGATVVLGLSRWVTSCSKPFTVAYAKSNAGTGNELRDIWGREPDGFAAQAVTIKDLELPWCPIVRGAVRGVDGEAALALRFDRRLRRSPAPSREAFTVRSHGGGDAPQGPVQVDEVGFPADPAGLRLRLARALAAGERLTVSYRRPPTGAALRDADGNAAAPFSTEAVVGAGGPPAVTAVAMASTPAGGDTYALGETIQVAVTFDAAVTVATAGGTPALTIDMDPADWGEKQAAYASGTGTETLVFAHEVVEPNYSTEGVAVLADTLAPNGGTIRSAGGADAVLAHDGRAHDPEHKVDWQRAPAPPSAPAFDDGDDAALAIDENHEDGAEVGTVAATDADGDAPTYSLSGDDAEHFAIGADGAISVASGTTLDHEEKASYAFTAAVTDGEDADGAAEETATADDTIAVTVSVANVEEPPGAPTDLALEAASTLALTASWTAPADTGALDIAGYELRWYAGAADPADASDWTETGDVGTETAATIAGLGADTAYRVQVRARGDGAGPWSASAPGRTAAPPAATGVAMASAPAGGETYALGETIKVAVTFDAAVTVDTEGGTPALTIDMDPAEWGEKQAAYASGTGTETLVFAHEVVEPNYSTQGVAVLADTLVLNGGTIRASTTGADADLGHDGRDHDPAHKVDWQRAPATPSAPAFDDGDAAALSIEENHADAAVVGTVAATDADGDAPSYSLSGDDAEHFAIGADGAISVASGTTLDRETKASYAFTAEVTDGEDGDGNAEATPTADDTIAVTVAVTNVEEPPGAPTRVTASAASATELSVGWTAPADTGALGIAGYELRWYVGSADPADDSDWTETGDVGTETSATIADLAADTAYRVQARARGDGTGPWSASGSGRTALPATAPAFDDGDGAEFSLAENHADGAAVGTVAATDADGDVPAYSLSGDDAADFAIGAGGAITVRSGTTLDFEAQARYAFTAEVTDGEDADGNAEATPTADDTIAVTVSVTNVEEPPGAPTGVSASAVSATELSVSWTAPADSGGLAVAGYALRWFAGDADPADASGWTETGDVGAATSATLEDLAADTAYRVQVRARGDGTGPWSASGAGRTEPPPDTTPPAPESATVNANTATLTFDEDVVEVLEPGRLRNLVMVTRGGPDGANQHPQRATVSGRTVTMELGVPARRGRTYTVKYFGSALADAAGNAVEPFSGLAAENLTLPTLWSENARAREAPGATLDFEVRMDAAADGTVTVDYATADGTAIAGEDYKAASGTVTFAAGETSRTVSVEVLDDAVDEGEEAMLLRFSNASGATLVGTAARNGATGVIENADPLPKAWLARFGRAAADQAMQAVSGRLTDAAEPMGALRLGGLEQYRPLGAAEAAAAAARYDALLDGQRHGAGPFGGPGHGGGFATADAGFGPSGGFGQGAPFGGFGAPGAGFGQDASFGASPGGGFGASGATFGAMPGHAPGLPGGGAGFGAAATYGGYGAPGATHAGAGPTFDLGMLLAGSSFLWGSGDEDAAGPRLTAWGRGAATRFDGLDDGVTLSGEVFGGTVGADVERGRWLAGIALSHADGRGDYSDAESGAAGGITSTLTSLHPYLRASLNERLDAWGMLGYGRGGLRLGLGEHLGTIDTELESRMGGLGLAGEVWSSERFRLAAKSDAMWSSTRSAATEGMVAASGDAGRARIAMEGNAQFALGAHQLTPLLEVGLRYDFGDAETGYGVELGLGLGYAHASGLSLDTRGRVLLAHEDDGYREWGASASLRYEPRPDGRGLRLGLESSLGAAWSGVERMWSMRDASELAPGMAAPPESRLTATLGYGFRAPLWRGLATPFLELDAAASGRQRAGVLLQRGAWGPRLEFSVERAPASGGGYGGPTFGGAPSASPVPADAGAAAFEASAPVPALREHRYLLRFSMPLGVRAATARPADMLAPEAGGPGDADAAVAER